MHHKQTKAKQKRPADESSFKRVDLGIELFHVSSLRKRLVVVAAKAAFFACFDGQAFGGALRRAAHHADQNSDGVNFNRVGWKRMLA